MKAIDKVYLLFLYLISIGSHSFGQTTVVDVLILYDDRAKPIIMNMGEDTFVAGRLAIWNKIMRNSEIDLKFRVTDIQHIAVSFPKDADMYEMSDWFFSTGPLVDNIQSRQVASSSDMILAYTVRDGFSNIIGLSRTPISTSALGILSEMHCDLHWALADINYSLSMYTDLHEISHTFGAQHGRHQKSNPGFIPEYAKAAGAWKWSVGNEVYLTIMHYSEDANSYWVPHISNPRVFHKGNATGNERIGNNAQAFEITKDIIARRSPAKAVVKYEDGQSAPNPPEPPPIPKAKISLVLAGTSGTELGWEAPGKVVKPQPSIDINEVEFDKPFVVEFWGTPDYKLVYYVDGNVIQPKIIYSGVHDGRYWETVEFDGTSTDMSITVRQFYNKKMTVELHVFGGATVGSVTSYNLFEVPYGETLTLPVTVPEDVEFADTMGNCPQPIKNKLADGEYLVLGPIKEECSFTVYFQKKPEAVPEKPTPSPQPTEPNPPSSPQSSGGSGGGSCFINSLTF